MAATVTRKNVTHATATRNLTVRADKGTGMTAKLTVPGDQVVRARLPDARVHLVLAAPMMTIGNANLHLGASTVRGSLAELSKGQVGFHAKYL